MALFLGVALFLNACSSDDTTGTSTPSTGGSDAGPTPAQDSGSTTTSTPLNGCTSYSDKGSAATLTWDISSSPPSTCVHIKTGGTVTFNGAFATHPLLPHGGASPTPLSTAPSGTTATFTFTTAGTYGFICGVHSTMTGAIEVTD
jgi:hypothetical protein